MRARAALRILLLFGINCFRMRRRRWGGLRRKGCLSGWGCDANEFGEMRDVAGYEVDPTQPKRRMGMKRFVGAMSNVYNSEGFDFLPFICKLLADA